MIVGEGGARESRRGMCEGPSRIPGAPDSLVHATKAAGFRRVAIRLSHAEIR